jgi:hypothetical protein
MVCLAREDEPDLHCVTPDPENILGPIPGVGSIAVLAPWKSPF